MAPRPGLEPGTYRLTEQVTPVLIARKLKIRRVFRRGSPQFFHAEPPTEPMAAMAVALAEKVEHDQRVTATLRRTGENRTSRLNLTELGFG